LGIKGMGGKETPWKVGTLSPVASTHVYSVTTLENTERQEEAMELLSV
jgi:hypothetical protein